MEKFIIQLKDFAGKLKNFNKYFWFFFLAIFFVILFLEFFVVMEAYEVIKAVQVKPEQMKASQGVRIKFEEYETALKRIEGASSFKSSIKLEKDPFR